MTSSGQFRHSATTAGMAPRHAPRWYDLRIVDQFYQQCLQLAQADKARREASSRRKLALPGWEFWVSALIGFLLCLTVIARALEPFAR